ncbi:hypothetical protein ABV290_003069 [Escherichia coli]|uniref:Uncharacterized protein n=1 Tax=Escherichia coli TaxID=562 RepID=A0A2W6PBW8_ECOLX|nr:hypothetical protein [Escherichia coli]EBG0945680.1 hypothetical protein [Salmonella enterica]EEV0481509.1 hypothetical protein [Escherichia coli O103]EFA4229952.1 hypothetical protein [Escherichia coli O40:H32]EFR0975394.1 hypothetical protein [Shigella flexneri]ELP2863942.1 hypothetical protein [Escherichia coli O33]KAE9906601.1 hypothetical protein GP695_19150 [Enterobacteriaceae bacterium TzEc051]
MTTTVFVAGSITIKKLDPLIVERLKKIVDKNFNVIVGDASGVDSSVQLELKQLGYSATTVFTSDAKPRNNFGAWPVKLVKSNFRPGTRDFYTAKDIKMAETADCGLMVWDTKSPGTLSNVIELLSRKKNSAVFINKTREFVLIKEPKDIDKLISFMSASSLEKVEDKIKLSERLEKLNNQQIALI